MEIQSITWYTVYKQQYTKSLTQFEQLQDSIPNLLECSIGSVRLSFGLQKQMKESVVEGAWSDSWSSNVLGLSRIREAGFCHSSIPLPFRSNPDQQKLVVTCRFAIHSKTPKFLWILINFFAKSLGAKGEKAERIGFWFSVIVEKMIVRKIVRKLILQKNDCVYNDCESSVRVMWEWLWESVWELWLWESVWELCENPQEPVILFLLCSEVGLCQLSLEFPLQNSVILSIYVKCLIQI